MYIAFIAPKSTAELSGMGHYYFLLKETLADWYKSQIAFKMLDNGAYEGTPLPTEELLKIAKEYGVKEIVATDYLKRYKQTMDETVLAIPKLKDYVDIAVTPQGSSIAEWIQCYKQMIELKNVKTICITKWLGKDRPMVIAHLIKNNLWKPKQFNYHIFGLDYVEELDTYRGMNAQIRSVDTSMPFSYAVQGKQIGYFTGEKIPRVKFDGTLSESQKLLAKENMKVLVELASTI